MHFTKKIIIAICILIIFFIAGLVGTVIYDTQSLVSKVIDYKPKLALKILDRKDRLIANVFDEQYREYVEFEAIPSRIIETLLAVEDTMFFEHDGMNLDAIVRAMLKNLRSGGLKEGGSTITQQLVKNVALTMERTIDRKLKEAVISIQVEQRLSKEEILEKYLNHIFFGNGFYGIKTAANGYFNKDLDNLSLKEIAMLMALPRAPSYYNPIKNLEFSLSRANTILERMYNIGWITQSEFETAIKEVPKVYNKTLTQNLAPYVVDEVLRQLGHIEDLKTAGYVVRTNIDLDYQKVAQDSLIKGYDNIIKRIESRKKKPQNEAQSEESAKSSEYDSLNGAIVITQSRTGKILAMSGGIDYTKSNFNRATQAQRQFGSTVKPFIYQIAFDMGYSQASGVSDIARSFESENIDEENIEQNEDEPWRPKNYTGRLSGIVPLKEALRRSLNLATINLVDMIGFKTIYNEMNRFGFKNMQQDMSIILGSFVLSPLEAAKYYSMFANYGSILEPQLIYSVVNANNEEIFAKSDEIAASEQLLEPKQAYLIIDAMQDVVNRGTGGRARTNGIELAGKTGTSNNNVDAWFSGFSPTLQIVVWYGRDDNTEIGSQEVGGAISAPVANEFFKEILKVEPGLKRVFDVPDGVYKRNINGENYCYTDISRLPENDSGIKLDDNLMF